VERARAACLSAAALEEGTHEYQYVRNTLVEMNLTLVRFAAGRFRNRSEPMDDIIQEIDIATGRLVFEWRGLEHVAVEESYLSPGGAYDYLHVNSIGLTPDGHLLVSGRHTCALYKVHRRTGRVLWRLGGRRSSFAVGRRARFHWQHDARHLPGGLITVFDNGAGPVKSEAQSRGLVLELDFVTNSVHLVRAYRHPVPVLSSAMGDVQTLADGNVMVGYGLVPLLSEVAPDGQLLGAVTVDGNTTAENYAVYGRAGWIGRISPRDEVAASVEVWQLWGLKNPGKDVALAKARVILHLESIEHRRPLAEVPADQRPAIASVRDWVRRVLAAGVVERDES